MLSTQKLVSLLPSKKLGETLIVFDEITSTNSFALEHAKHQALPATVILADKQTAGRGRLNRPWFSPPQSNIYGSLIYFYDRSLEHPGWIPLIAGVAIGRAVQMQTGIRLQLKWPNDLIIAEQKVGGILCESFTQTPNTTCVVIGFGINVNLSPFDIPHELRPYVTSLQMTGHRWVDREALIIRIINCLEEGLESLTTNTYQSWQLEYQTQCATMGQDIQVLFPDGSRMEGLAHSVGENGQLRVSVASSTSIGTSESIREIHSGEILHLRPR